jgi:formylglycine-generating enzyme required for sulfatase activity
MLAIFWPVLLLVFACDDAADLEIPGYVLDPGGDGDTDADTDVDADTDDPFDPASLIEWVAIPGGSFQMGDDLFPESSPVHQVEIPVFEIARYEVTNAQYEACVEHDQCDELTSFIDDGEDHPVRGVLFPDARSFCTWVGGSLPSEAQWEYAARNLGVAVAYPWGEATATCDWAVMATAPGPELFWGCDTGTTAPVCSKPDGNTSQGLCDMAGNAWEWVHDAWHDSYDGAPDDGSPWGEDLQSDRVIRGGGLNNTDPHHLRASFRFSVGYTDFSSVVGFRCAREAQE